MESVVSSLSYSIITYKNDLTEEKAIIKQVLMENGYQESILTKSSRELLRFEILDNKRFVQKSGILTFAALAQNKQHSTFPYV